MTRCCGSRRTGWMTRAATGSCCPRGTGGPPITRCWRLRVSSRSHGSPGFGSAGSRLGYHPDRNLIPGVEIASGSLGHGLPIAVGLAHGLIAQGLAEPRVFVLVG